MVYTDTANQTFKQLIFTLMFVLIILATITYKYAEKEPRVLEREFAKQCQDNGKYITAKSIIITCEVH